MPELLTGTVTFVFTDIEGSTRLLQSHGQRWSSVLARHQELLRTAFAAHGGVEVSTEGDSFFVTFPTAPGAVAAVVAAQRALAHESWPDGLEVRVRMGMHTGDASFGTEGYVGLHVHRASRIASVGHGGQVLLSDATRSLITEALPDGVELRDLGEHRLRDLEKPERLWQLVVADLQNDFSPIASVDTVPNNLPTRLTTFLGRAREIAEVSELLADNRLLTLTGPGGTGKTRLSLEVARRSFDLFPGGVFLVELATISLPELVPGTIGKALGLPDRGGRSSVDRLIDHIGERRMLLVLDNFEQVTDAAPSIVALLAACPNLAVMTSSRSMLHISGEQEYPVPPLGLPDPANLPPLTQLSQFEAVALFIERARSVKPDFDVTNENAPAVAEICVRLDGLPLAIELAAARTRIFTPQSMLSRLENRLGLLAGGSRDLPERQQTLRGAIAWSHDMLNDADRDLFACIAVFVGGAGLEAIEEVCSGELSGEVLDALGSLVEKSLVRQSEGVDGEPRFGMLETIREFAVEQAIERKRWSDLRARHAALFAAFAQDASPMVMGSSMRTTLDRLEQDHDNLRAAMTWAIETGASETGMRIGSAMWRFWQMRGYLPEGLERLETLLAQPNSFEHPERRADALNAAAGIAYWLSETERSRALYEEEIEARRALGDPRALAEALYGISFTWSIVHGLLTPYNAAQAQAYVDQAQAIFEEIGDESGIGRCEWATANVAFSAGAVDVARRHAHVALEVFERIGDAFMVGWVNYTLALADMLDDFQTSGGMPAALDEARAWFYRALDIFADAQDISGYTLVLDGLALLAFRTGERERAARLSAFVAKLERQSGTGLNLWNRSVLGFDPDQEIRADPDLADAWAVGEAMTSDEA
ncbi:MAG TPA: adenylate/guanylate cyclase domain-containing protein, partial [Candidatus Limnocylindrales bacterium]|nr:adenylate/guanylate cyclase domain-containing protein [Candidatus Limnocylindrales bacterium]